MEAQDHTAIKPLRLGDIAPDFRARSTTGPVQLADYRGRWTIFFSHPADFTPVCSTEFVEIARRQAEFEALDCALLGLSVDSLYSHLAWVQALHDVFGAKVGFPVIEDPSMAIGRAYGMIDDQSADSMTMRSTYFIDPDGVIRAITCYPHDVGRSVDEMLRMVRALQAVSTHRALAPEGWRDGEPLLALPLERSDGTPSRPDWFCRPLEAG